MSHMPYEEWLAVYGDLGPGERERVDEHLRGCPECAARLEGYRAIRQALRARPALGPDERLPQAFYGAVARAREEDRRRPLQRTLLRVGDALAWVGVAAVVALLAVSLAITWRPLLRQRWLGGTPADATGAWPARAGDLAGSWVLAALNGKPLVEGTQITILFRDGEAAGFAGCNRYALEYRVTGEGGLSIELGAMTVEGCVEPEGVLEQEEAYAGALRSVTSYRLAGDRLELADAAGETILTYRRRVPLDMNPAALVGTEWQLVSWDGRPPIEGSPITIAFGEGEISGQAGCRGYTGTYEAGGDHIRFPILGMTETEPQCSQALQQQEGEYTTCLSWVSHYRLGDGQLELLTERGETLLYVSAQPSPTSTPTPTVAAVPSQCGSVSIQPPEMAHFAPVEDAAGAIAYSNDGLMLTFPEAATAVAVHSLLGKTTEVDRSFAWSPDGRQIAFVHALYGPPLECQLGYLMLADLDLGEVRVLLPSPGVYSQPAWSPGGERLAFVQVTEPGLGELSVLHVASGALSTLGERACGWQWLAPAWLDDEHVLYARASEPDPQRLELVSQPLSEGGPRTIVPAAETFGLKSFAFSPPARRLVYNRGSQVVVVDVDTGATRSVGTVREVTMLQWAPDARLILAYAGLGELYLVPAEPGQTIVSLDVSGRVGQTQGWSPDSQRFAMVAAPESRLGVYDVNRQVLESLPVVVGPPWEVAWGSRAVTPSATPAPPGLSIKPVVTGGDIDVDSWSPDGEWLAFWQAKEDAIRSSMGPPMALHFYHGPTGEVCSYPKTEMTRGARCYLSTGWTADGHFAIWDGGTGELAAPCRGSFRPAGDAVPTPTPRSESSSPGGGYRVATVYEWGNEAPVEVVSTFTDAATGRAVQVVEYDHAGGDTPILPWGPGGEWVTDDLFLINYTRDRRPLLVDLEQARVVEVGPELFGTEWDPVGEGYHADVHAATDGGYHIALSAPRVRLYHSETGQVEELDLPNTWWPGFSPDGQWLLMVAHPERPAPGSGKGTVTSDALWARPVDPPGSRAQFVAEGRGLWPLCSPHWTWLAMAGLGYEIGQPKSVSIYSFPEGRLLGSWDTGEYLAYQGGWSEDGERLAVVGNIPATGKYGLFVVEP